MITCQLKQCGLGSQLFQIATTLALAWDNNDLAVFDFLEQGVPFQGKIASKYSDTIYRNLTQRTSIKVNAEYTEPFHHYQKIPYQPNLCLNGFFMSEKYFKHRRKKLLKVFEPEFDRIVNLVKRHSIPFENCAIHVRRGDYLKLGRYHPVCGMDYYLAAIDRFDRDTTFLVFSDDIEWCRSQFIGDRFVFIENDNDIDDLYLMSLCQHQIIANSTFSWWAAWLNENPNKMVVAPEIWLGTECKRINTDDIYTPEMIRI